MILNSQRLSKLVLIVIFKLFLKYFLVKLLVIVISFMLHND